MEPLGSPPKANKKKRPSTVNGEPDGVDLSKLRAHAACKNCRVKKVKCLPFVNANVDASSGPGPCQQCVAAGSECVYPPTRDRAAYSRQYVQNLEARLQALEGVWGRVAPMLEAFEGGANGSAAINSANGVHPLIPKLPPPDSDDEEEDAGSDRPDLEDGQITQDERGNYRWIGSSNTLSLLDSFSGQPLQTPLSSTPHTHTPDRNPYFGPVAGSGVVKALPGVDEVSYPTHRAAREMVDAFFSDVHPTLPVVVEYEFRQEFDALMDRRSRGEVETSSQTFVSVLFAVFALGERVVVANRAWQRARSTNKGDVLPGEAETGVIWFERAQILHYTTLKDVNLHQVQCLTLMAAFQAAVNAMPTAWLFAGQAIRVAQDLGLHRHNRVKMSFTEKQLRSRCWWAIYGLERMVSIALGRPLGVDDLDIDVAYPSEVDDSGLKKMLQEGRDHTPDVEPHGSTMSGFVALTKLCKIAGRVTHLLYRPSNRSVVDPHWANSQQHTINKLDKSLRDWLANEVPSKYKDPSTNRPVQLVSAVLSNSYFAVLITLHRNFLPSNPDYPRPKPPPSSQSLSHCVDAARSVIHVASQSRIIVPPSHHLAVFCQYLWSSAVILLLCEVQAKDQVVIEAVGSKVQSCRRALQDLEPVWPGSKKLRELLDDVENRAKEVVHDPKKRKVVSPDKKRPSVDKRTRLETSDTRTNMPTDPMGAQQQYQPMNPPALDMSMFDVGGVTFDGLEMLQGFQGVDPANIWSTLGDTFIQTPTIVNPNSGQGTPNSAQGPSPGGWSFAQQAGGMGMEQTELWSQVAGGSFDWQADPSVPFQI